MKTKLFQKIILLIILCFLNALHAASGQDPYPGSNSHPVPGIIQTEDYDSGGEAVAYHDTTSGNSGNQYRSENVDIETCGEGGYDVGWIAPGEWLEYTVNVASSGTYDITARVASQSSGGSMHIEFDGVNVTGSMTIPSTGGWQNWTSIYATGVVLSAGPQIMRISMDSGGWNLNWVELVFTGSGSYNCTVTVDASSYIRPIPETMYGTNMQCWDEKQNGGNENVNAMVAAIGSRNVRWPGGSGGNVVLWRDIEVNYTRLWEVSYDETMYRMNKFDSIMQPIVNFPGIWSDANGTDVNHWEAGAIAAVVDWVKDQSSRINCARYWEIGNEIGGPWEAGYFPEISGVYYGDRYANFYNAMKAINPQIKIGACAEPCDTYQPWGWYVGKWTRDLLTTTDANHGLRPDFLIIHSYPGSGQGPSYNSTLLSSDLQIICDDTASLNNIIATSIGPQYVGKIKYWMTEWDPGKTDTYDRERAYVGALFNIQYILEMCKYGWEGSNPWSQNIYYMDTAGYPNYYVWPRWYAIPILNHYFGRDMVAASSTNSSVRAYASRDDANNLIILMANNYSGTDRTVRINISGYDAGTTGQRWLIQPAGSTVPGGINIQDYNDLMINGIVHPGPSTIASLNGVSIATDNVFDIPLPRSSIMIIKIPPAAATTQLSYNGTAWPIPGTIEAEDYDTGGKFVAYYDTTAGNSGGQYRSDDVDIETCSEGGYDVTNLKVKEWLEYTVNVESSGLYKITAWIASVDSNGEFRIEFDGNDETGPVIFSATGGAQVWGDTDVNVFLKKGEHTMRLLADTNDWSINRLVFSKVGGGTGKALREWWTTIGGTAISILTSNVKYPWSPTARELSRSFEGPSVWSPDFGYGSRIRGYLNPVSDGNYTFWIAGNNACELWLSTDDNPCNISRIAKVTTGVNPYEWDHYADQISTTIPLVAGQRYYIEAIHIHGGGYGPDTLSVAWEGPGIIRQAITGAYLSPYVIDFMDFGNFASQWLKTTCASGTGWCSGSDYNHDGNVQLDDLMQFVVALRRRVSKGKLIANTGATNYFVALFIVPPQYYR